MTKSTFVTWYFELYPDLETLRAQRDRTLPKKLPNLTNRTEVRGYLTENRCGLRTEIGEDAIEGYYVTTAVTLLGLHQYDDEEEDELYNLYGYYLALLYMGSDSDEPKVVGVFDPRSWKEEYPQSSTAPASFRLPEPLLEEFKEACSAKNVSQATIITTAMWDFVWGKRYEYLIDTPAITLGNGEKWEPDFSIPYVRIGTGDGR
ncbi:MAG: hypothetical protein LLF90_00730 [Methanomicrobiaceae archaeon]|uniref:hypothetical protein n=1 Tax=Methanoculleus sp. TaxID=90427 RepID=UPI0032117248|nr:hypothetical protein [Methanomicrobiaceae archaeon]